MKLFSKGWTSIKRADVAGRPEDFSVRRNVCVGPQWFFLVLAAAGLMGCSDGLVEVRGRVTLDDQPLEGATVTFTQANGLGRPVSGYTDAGGNFQLTTFQSSDGILPGEYKVSIAKITSAEGLEEDPDNPDDVLQKAFRATNPMDPYFANVKRLTPALYADPQRTPLLCKVSSATQPVVFNLDSQIEGPPDGPQATETPTQE